MILGLVAMLLGGPVRAQDHTVVFSTTDPGVSRSITNWGLDTGWASFDNMQRGLTSMGATNVKVVQVAFEVNAPLTNNEISPARKAAAKNMVTLGGGGAGRDRAGRVQPGAQLPG